MSAVSTPNDSPVSTPIQPLHNPSQAAHTVVPQAPGMGAKALLAKRMAKNHNPTYISPTDKLMTPCTQKLSAAKKKHFTKAAKPIQLFAQREEPDNQVEGTESGEESPPSDEREKISVDDENPF